MYLNVVRSTKLPITGKKKAIIDLMGEHAQPVLPDSSATFSDVPKDQLLVAIVHNATFEAALIIQNEDQYEMTLEEMNRPVEYLLIRNWKNAIDLDEEVQRYKP